MKRFLKKPFSWAILFSLILIGTSTYVLLDAFVIPKTYSKAVTDNTVVLASTSEAADSAESIQNTSHTDNAETGASVTPGVVVTSPQVTVTPVTKNTTKTAAKKNKKKSLSTKKSSNAASKTSSVTNKTLATKSNTNSTSTKKTTSTKKSGASSKSAKTSSGSSSSKASFTDNSYKDDNIKISIDTNRQYNTSVYVADVKISSIAYLKAAFADNTYGRNIKAATSTIAKNHSAIFAVNGDFYGFRDYGYVLRNGTVYRDTAGEAEDLVINNKGRFSIIDETKTSVSSLSLKSIWQILSFGPALINGGDIQVDESSEVSQSMSSNPRTAIGMIAPLHYMFVVSDGRTSESAGLSLLELATIMKNKGCTVAYNLDGGGSSTMYFNGKVINNPTDGHTNGERKVSDIVYIGK